ncbi:MAG: AAA family ATPase [Kiritimatiellaeota bacterium]|nr:AAA family ATPase [Kiritimatiellota bacterium]
MKPIYIVGTKRHVGKTTLALGLLHGLRERGFRTAYLKPLGQHFSASKNGVFHNDARVVSCILDSAARDTVEMAVSIGRGRIQEELKARRGEQYLRQIEEDVERLAVSHNAIVLEGMGNVAMGACLQMSAADVARTVSARSLLVVEAGVGRTIDEILLCATFIATHGADFMGVVVSKAWPAKYDRIAEALTKGLADRGIPLFGITPFQEELASPTVQQVFEGLGGELLGGEDHLSHRVSRTIIGAMQAHNMSSYITDRTLVITPGDRSDVIMASLRVHMIGGDRLSASGLVLTCGQRPTPETLEHIRQFHLPVMLVDGDTYSVACELRNRIYKITPDDKERIDWAVRLVSEHVDIDRMVEALKA